MRVDPTEKPIASGTFAGQVDAALLKAVLDTAVDGILTIDGSGSIITANPAVEGIFGYARDELIGQNVKMLMPAPYHEEHDEYLTNYHETGERKIIGIGREVRGLKKDGTVFPLELAVGETTTEQGPIFTGIIRDISARKRAEDELVRERALFRAVVETAVDGIITIDEKGIIRSANSACESIFGYGSAEMIGKNVRMLMPSPYHEEHDQYLANFVKTSVKKIIGIGREVQGLRKNGEVFPLDLAVSETHTGAGLVFTGIVRDITERKQATTNLRLAIEETERQVRERTADLAHANAELQSAIQLAESANLAKSEFLSRMSHELRTPMNSVLGYAQLLDLQYQDPKIKSLTRPILRAGKHLLEMIDEVLDLTRIEQRELALSNEPVDLTGVLRQAIGLLQPLADAATIGIAVEGELCEDIYVEADRQRLLQVLINLLGNSIKYNREGGKIVVRYGPPKDGVVHLEISDTGLGIKPSDQQLLFRPFQRFGDPGIEGTGLGLCLSQKFVMLMGGKLGLAESTPDGSTFYFELSSAPAPRQSMEPLAEDSASNSLASLRGKVLYIEDNPFNMQLLETVLEDCEGITLIPAVQGMVGLDLAHRHQPNVIFLDLHLPDTMGDKVLERLKADPITAAIPVVILSADATKRQIDTLLAAGAVEYLTKPIDLVRLFEILRQFLPEA